MGKTINETFDKLTGLNKNDKILFLTHVDLDGTGAILLKSVFNNVDVKHLSNGQMSLEIKKSLSDPEIYTKYDKIIACDISCSDRDAEIIDRLSTKNQFILLDHHDSAKGLNKYAWAVVDSIKHDDVRLPETDKEIYKNREHSSGISLLFDYLESKECLTPDFINPDKLEFLNRYVNEVAMYDTWDWQNVFHGERRMPKDLNDLMYVFGIDSFEKRIIEKAEHAEIMHEPSKSFFDDVDIMLLESTRQKVEEYVNRAVYDMKPGELTLGDKTYSVCFSYSSQYMSDVFDMMKKRFPDVDLYLINYGSGVSLRASKPEINVSDIVKELGGGGHPGAGGFRIPEDKQIEYISKAMHGSLVKIEPVREMELEIDQ